MVTCTRPTFSLLTAPFAVSSTSATCVRGDPACDLSGGWLLLPDGGIDRFLLAYRLQTRRPCARARGWAIVKALACLVIGDNGIKGLPGGKPTWGPPAEAALLRITA